MKRLMILTLLLLIVPVASAQRLVHPTTDMLLLTRDGWLVTGIPSVLCGTTTTPFFGCENPDTDSEPTPEFIYPLPDDGVLITAGGANVDIPLYLTLSQEGNLIAEEVIAADEEGVVEWQPDVPAGDYILTVQVVPEGESEDAYMLYFYGVRVLTEDEAEDFFPSPPPLLLHTVDGWVVGLHGSYCFPPEGVTGCVDVEMEPMPDEYWSMQHGDAINLRLQAQPHPDEVLMQLLTPDDREIAAELEFELNDAEMNSVWTPEVAFGDYILRVRLAWGDTSDATYIFGVTIADPGSVPQFSLWTADNVIVGGAQASYCWEDEMGALCRDFMFVIPDEFHNLVEDNVLYVVLQSNNFPEHVYASLFTTEMESVLETTEMRAPEPGIYTLVLEDVPEGDYIAMISGTWEEGDAANIFGVHVES